jgi:glycosyltransferase involved in cell wall biosynthesis
MSGAPWLSVLLPVHGVGPLLDDCVASILDQGVPGIELVFVDDASTPEDRQRLAAWQARRPDEVRVVAHEGNRGVAAARNTLLDHARGDWLWFVDPDDLVEPGALAALQAVAVAADAPDLVLFDFRSFRDGVTERAHVKTFEGPSRTRSHDRDALLAGLFRTGQWHPWSKVVRRAAWPAALRFPEGRVFEDLAVYPRLALSVASFVHLPEVWIAYRQRSGSILSQLSAQKLDDWTQALVGYPVALRDGGVRLSDDTLFEIAHFSARTLLRAVRRWRALCTHAYADERLQAFAARWRASSPLTADELARAYLRRRKIGRWAQFLWTLRVIERD